MKVDEAAGVLFYMARDGDNHMKLQLHRVGLDGKGDVRLTDPEFHHTSVCTGGAARRRGGLAVRRPAAFRPTTSTSSTSIRRTTCRRRRARRRQRQGRRRAREERLTKFDAARPQEGRDVHLQGGGRQDDAARA